MTKLVMKAAGEIGLKNVVAALVATTAGVIVTIEYKLTKEQLIEAFQRAGYLDQEVLGVNNDDQTFLWTDDCGNYGENTFSLYLNSKGELCAEMGGCPIREWN